MAKYSVPVVATLFGALISGVPLTVVGYRIADHDSWARSLTWGGIWVVWMSAVILGTHVWQQRRDERAQRLEDAAAAQSQVVQVHRPPIKMR